MVAKQAAADWRERYADKLVSPREAMGLVEPGDSVWVGGLNSVPLTLCGALAELAPGLPGVTVYTFLTPFDWNRPAVRDNFRLYNFYLGPVERDAVQAGQMEYVPAASFREGRMPNGMHREYDVAAIPISPPNDDGYCSFGTAVFFAPVVLGLAKQVIGEIHPEFIRTGGENSVHISRFVRIAEAGGPPPPPPIPPRSEETVYAAEVICTLVAAELIKDRDTLQIGIGDVSAAMALYLGDKHDLGIHTELLPGGVTDLVERGVVTGTYKEVHPGKVVASVAAQLSPEELAYIDGNPVFELYQFGHTDDLRVILQFSQFAAINNALLVDVTGNVSAETWGPRVWSGSGGQPTFSYAANVISGRSIIVLPSSQLVGDPRQPRVVAALPEGSTVTSHRAFVDYVVTEQGIAHLSGRSIRERAAELISVAHPDLRAELRDQVRRLYGFTL